MWMYSVPPRSNELWHEGRKNMEWYRHKYGEYDERAQYAEFISAPQKERERREQTEKREAQRTELKTRTDRKLKEVAPDQAKSVQAKSDYYYELKKKKREEKRAIKAQIRADYKKNPFEDGAKLKRKRLWEERREALTKKYADLAKKYEDEIKEKELNNKRIAELESAYVSNFDKYYDLQKAEQSRLDQLEADRDTARKDAEQYDHESRIQEQERERLRGLYEQHKFEALNKVDRDKEREAQALLNELDHKKAVLDMATKTLSEAIANGTQDVKSEKEERIFGRFTRKVEGESAQETYDRVSKEYNETAEKAKKTYDEAYKKAQELMDKAETERRDAQIAEGKASEASSLARQAAATAERIEKMLPTVLAQNNALNAALDKIIDASKSGEFTNAQALGNALNSILASATGGEIKPLQLKSTNSIINIDTLNKWTDSKLDAMSADADTYRKAINSAETNALSSQSKIDDAHLKVKQREEAEAAAERKRQEDEKRKQEEFEADEKRKDIAAENERRRKEQDAHQAAQRQMWDKQAQQRRQEAERAYQERQQEAERARQDSEDRAANSEALRPSKQQLQDREKTQRTDEDAVVNKYRSVSVNDTATRRRKEFSKDGWYEPTQEHSTDRVPTLQRDVLLTDLDKKNK